MKEKKCEIKLYWTVTVWPKWQLVIPKEIRNKLKIKPGDSITVLMKNDKFIGLVRNEDITELMEYVNNEKKD